MLSLNIIRWFFYLKNLQSIGKQSFFFKNGVNNWSYKKKHLKVRILEMFIQNVECVFLVIINSIKCLMTLSFIFDWNWNGFRHAKENGNEFTISYAERVWIEISSEIMNIEEE